MTQTQLVFSTDDPETVAAWRNVQAEFNASREKTWAEAEKIGKNKGPLVRRSAGDLDVVGLAADDPQDPPAGWRYVREQLEPRRGKPGDEARRWLASVQPPNPRNVMDRHGLPKYFGFLGTPGIFEHDGVVWAVYGGKPDGEVGGQWRPRKLSEFYAAKESYEAAEAAEEVTR